MKLILENAVDVEFITEETNGKKNLFIEGVFMQYDTPNRNGRIYSRSVMEKEVNRYITEAVAEKRSVGELNHPQGPTINLDRVTHLIEKLEMQPNGIVYGKARVLDTFHGKEVRALLEGGIKLGVSSRGLGSLKEGKNGIMEVQEDFRLVTAADIVSDPSAPAAFVNGIMEGYEWYFDDKRGEWSKKLQEEIKTTPIKRIDEAMMLKWFNSFVKTL